MKGKVNCTCGWSWNKSDSSKKDMYICHECGRDNSNNMKNGGWLDNYGTKENPNDSSVSLPEGFVGMGNNTKGRDYSPAWGGQFEEGGKIPMAQNGRATRADSLAVYNNTKAIEDYYKQQKYKKEKVKDTEDYKKSLKDRKEWLKTTKSWLDKAKFENELIPGYYTNVDKEKEIKQAKETVKRAAKDVQLAKDKIDPKKYIQQLNKSKEDFKKRRESTYVDQEGKLIDRKPSLENYFLPIDENKFYQREQSHGFLDLRSPMPLYDKRITPQDVYQFRSPNLVKRDELESLLVKTKEPKKRKEIQKEIDSLEYTDNVESYAYDPLAVMPFDMVPPELQQERVEKYGLSGVPQSVIDAHPEWLKNTNQPVKTQTLQPRVKAINLSPIQTAPISFPIQEIDVTKRFEEPKSFNVSSQRMNMLGPSDYYNYNQEGVDYETAMIIKAASDAYNKDIEKRYGPQNEYRTPKSAEKAAERLKQLRSEFTMTPNYQMGGYVYPVNYVPQAQNGFTSFMSNLGDNIVEFFSDEKEEKIKPIKKTSVKKSGNKDNTRTLNIVDPRKKLATTNQPLRPNSDLVGGKYSSKHLDRLIQEAKRQGMSKQDIMNLSAMGFQETKWGKTDGNIGHVMGDWGGDDDYQLFINAYNAKMKEADRLGITDPAMRLQVYNGLGTITPSTEKDYHGFEMQKIYGVPIPKGGISMKKNPLYGKQVMDIRDNVLAKNPEYIKYMDSIYKAPLKKKAMGGSIPGSVGFTYARTKGIPSEGPYAKKTMPSAQEGKTITVDEGEGKKRKILTDSSEYAKLYDEGRIGVQNDDESISFNPLNEVVVTPYDKQFPYYQQLTPSEQKYLRENLNSNDPITRQLKARATDGRGFDADKATDFAMGWLRDLPLASLQAPQSALVEGVEALRGNDFNMLNALDPSTQRIPSETWGVENPYAAFAVDALTDPETLMGMSLLKQPLQKGLQQTGKYLTEETALKNAYKYNPWAFKPNPEAYYRGLGKEGMEDALQSGVFRPKNAANTKKEFVLPGGQVFEFGKSFDKTYYSPDFKIADRYGKGFVAEVPNNSAEFTRRYSNKDWSYHTQSQIPVEQGRILQKDWLQGYKPIEVPKQNNIKPSFIKQDLSEGNDIKYSFTDDQENNIGTFSGKKTPSGVYVSSIQINPELRRQGLASKIYKDIAKDLQSKNEGTLFSRSTQHQFTDKDELGRSIAPANKLWENLVNKGEAEKFVEGMSHTYKIKPLKEGGVIKDDMGQWEHPGEITEINSPYITMQGVPYPVLGISDTGDTQMMYPEEEYEFDGTKVTEFPMAKNGLRQEQKGLVNLDNLLNFTNYNTKQPGGWLDKY